MSAPPLVTAKPVPTAAPSVPPPVVLELFTSQGCAFCPPADELMGQMIQQQGIIGLSCHVDYFTVRKNNLGKSFCTKRQSFYNRVIATGPRYTPQLVVNGHLDMIGYETGKVSAAILKARAEKVKTISFTDTGAGTYSFTLPSVNAGGDPLVLWLAVYDLPKKIAMTEGSNFGKNVNYVNVVSEMRDLGSWDGKAEARAIEAATAPHNRGFAVVAQNARNGHIVAAGAVEKPQGTVSTASPAAAASDR